MTFTMCDMVTSFCIICTLDTYFCRTVRDYFLTNHTWILPLVIQKL